MSELVIIAVETEMVNCKRGSKDHAEQQLNSTQVVAILEQRMYCRCSAQVVACQLQREEYSFVYRL